MSDIAVTVALAPLTTVTVITPPPPTVGLVTRPPPTVDLIQPALATATVVQPPLPTVALTAVLGSSGPNEIWIGQTEPTDPTVEMWWRPDTVIGAWDSATWDSATWA